MNSLGLRPVAIATGISLREQRREQRRQRTIEQALAHAVDVMNERGVGPLTISEVARRMSVQPPSLYKYFDSLHAMYDRLFGLGLAGYWDAVSTAISTQTTGEQRLRAAARAGVEWCVTHPALAQLLFWRPVPQFNPSAETFAASIGQMQYTQAELTAAIQRGELAAETDVDQAMRLLTVILSGLISQQLANQPGVPFAEGAYSRLTDTAVDMYLSWFRFNNHSSSDTDEVVHASS